MKAIQTQDQAERRLLQVDFELETASPPGYRDAQEKDYLKTLEREREGLAWLFENDE